jgi:flagellar export protein FliJ
MKRDPLRTMLRVRQSTLDEAQKAVADAYRAEQDAANRAEAASAALEREMKTATSLAGGDDAVETFARWLPIGRRDLKQAHDAQRDATSALDRARAVLALARSGVKTVESLIEQRQAACQIDDNRREQRVLDEAGSRRIGG